MTRARESNLEGGWQIWIEASDFDERDAAEVLQLGEEAEKDLQDKVADPVLGEDFVIAPIQSGWMQYEFESPEEGEAHGYHRVMDYRGGGQSWHVMLNTENNGQGMNVDTAKPWVWNSARDGAPTTFPMELIKGTNTVRIAPREAGPGVETLFDIICISTKEFRPKPVDDDFLEARPLGDRAVDSVGKLTTMWGTIRGSVPGEI